MKIKVEHLGILEQAEIELKPLTVFVGQNVTGKTWLAYTIAALLGGYGYNRYQNSYGERESKIFDILDSVANELLEAGTVSVDLDQFVDDHLQELLSEIAILAPTWLQDFFDTDLVTFDDTKISLEVNANDLDQSKQRIRKERIRSGLAPRGAENTPLLRLEKEPDSSSLFIYEAISKEEDNQIPQDVVRRFIVDRILQIIQTSLYEDVAPFPVERTVYTAIPYSSFEAQQQDYGEFTGQNENDGKRNRNGRNFRMSSPLRAMTNMMVGILVNSVVPEKGIQTPFEELVNVFEPQILKGQIGFGESRVPGHKGDLIYTHNSGVPIELSLASSMIKQSAALSLYLRYLAEPYDLVVIDEPEMNLHPEAQAQMMEFLVMMVNAGMRVLITTHSPYMVDHLTNLIQASDSEENDVENSFYLKSKDAFISKNDVSVYLYGDGTATSILDDEGYIDYATFADTSDRLEKIIWEI